MTEQLQNFINSLREELRHYGELLALLETGQVQIVRCRAGDLLVTLQALHAEGEALQVVCRERAQRQRELAQSLALPVDARVAAMLPRVPQAQQPLLLALAEESNQLLLQVRQRARDNHGLLSRSLELMEKFITSIGATEVPVLKEQVVAPTGTRGND